MGRVLTQVWPRIYDQAQIVRILGEDDKSQFVRVQPDMPQGYMKAEENGKEVIYINPGAGRYDARAVVGPAYATRQTEAAAEISELVNGNPQMLALLGDVWVKMRNFPEADKISKRFKAMLPPQVQEAEKEGEEQQDIPPEVQQALQGAAQEIQALRDALQQAQQAMQGDQAKAQQAMQIEAFKRDTALMLQAAKDESAQDREELKGVIELLKQQIQPPPALAMAASEDLAQ